jgi:hypothetical protein
MLAGLTALILLFNTGVSRYSTRKNSFLHDSEL